MQRISDIGVGVSQNESRGRQRAFLGSRTVDMHVRNILRKLDFRSRGEATHRAGEFGLLA